MQSKKQLIYQFGEFRLERDRQKLFRGDEQIALPNKAVELLALLIEERGRTVTKEEILERVWEGAIVEENNLAVNISQLRKAFGETSKEARFIETIPRKGYRFLAAVEEIDNSFIIEKRTTTEITIQEKELPQTAASSETIGLKQSLRRQSLALGVIGILVAVLGAGFAYLFWGVSQKSSAQKPVVDSPAKIGAARSIAVLPLKSLNQKETDESLNVGLTDALITKLGNIRGLAVRPTSSVLRFAHENLTPPEIAKKLNVDAVLEGSVQTDGERLRISVQLVRASDEQVIWSGNFNEKSGDLFKFQDAFAANVADALLVNLSIEERASLARRETENSEAYNLYLKGRYFWNRRNLGSNDNFRKAIESFEQARQKDPNFVAAYVGLADAYQLLGEYTGGSDAKADLYNKAREAAQKALELDPNSGEAHASFAYTLAFYDWRWQDAEREFQRAIELKPNYATARQWYSEYLVVVGRFDEGFEQIRIAQKLDPLSLIIETDVAGHYYMSRQFDKAIEQADKILEMEPNFIYALSYKWISFEQKGDLKTAAEVLMTADALYFPPELVKAQREAYEKGGWQEYMRVKNELAQTSPIKEMLNDYQRAISAHRIGNTDETFFWLNKSCEARNRWFVNLKYDPQWDAIRSDARFAELVRKANLNP